MLYFLLLISIFLAKSETHPIHLTKSSLEFNAEAKTLQISIHIFLDDLELALETKGAASNLQLCTPKEHPKGEQYLISYLREQFHVQVDEMPMAFKFIGKEISEDFLATWCYLEVEGVETFKSLKVTNKILMEIYDDQRNIVQVKGPNQKKVYFMFDSKQQAETFKF
jgi:hypothetical protein